MADEQPAAAPSVAVAEKTVGTPAERDAASGFVDLDAGEKTEAEEPAADDEKPDGEKPEGETGTEAKAEGDEEEPDKPKRPSRSERYQRQIERLRAENEELRRQPAVQSEAALNARLEEVVGPRPKESDYNGDYLAYERALTAYELDRRQSARELKTQATRQAERHAEIRREQAEAHQERVEEFREKAKDFDQVMASAAALKASPAVEDLVLESDHSAQLVYYLAKNPSRLDALNQMTERSAAREIGRIEEKLSKPDVAKKATQATKPIAPLKGGASSAQDPAKMSMPDYIRWRKASSK